MAQQAQHLLSCYIFVKDIRFLQLLYTMIWYLAPIKYSCHSLNASTIAISSQLGTRQQSSSLYSFFKKKATGQSLPSLSCCPSCPPRANPNASVSTLYGFSRLGLTKIGCSIIAFLTKTKALFGLVFYTKGQSFFIMSISSITVFL